MFHKKQAKIPWIRPQSTENMKKVGKWNYIKLKNTVKGAVTKVKKQPTEQKETFTNSLSDKRLIE